MYVVVATFVKPDGAWLGKQNASIWLWDTVWAASASRAWLPLLSLLIAFQLVQARDNDSAALPVIYITCYLILIYAVLHYEHSEALKIKVLSRLSHHPSHYAFKLLDYFHYWLICSFSSIHLVCKKKSERRTLKRGIRLSVTRVSWEPFVWSTSHSAGLLLRTWGRAGLNLVQFGNINTVWVDGKHCYVQLQGAFLQRSGFMAHLISWEADVNNLRQ